jgi:type IV pilus assembly protein PilW
MSPKNHKFAVRRRPQQGFTLVELMVTVAIAVFLIFGLVTVVENIRGANLNQQALAQLQDEQRFAMTVLTDVIQSGGYYTQVTTQTETSTLPAVAPMIAGQPFYGVHAGGTTPDTITVRYQTAGQDGVILCDGSSNQSAAGTYTVYTNVFTITQPAGNTPGTLNCQLNGGAVEPLVYGLYSMTIYYGVNRNAPGVNYNVDTYLTADQMCTGCASNDWMNVTSVRVVLVFNNPLYPQPGQPQYITIERVVQVMGRAGYHS